jgi:hypothetical protein
MVLYLPKKMIEEMKGKTAEEIHNLRPLGELEKLPTRRLLAFYRVERRKLDNEGYWDSTCEEWVWDTKTEYEHLKAVYESWVSRLEAIKAILGTREHVQKRVLKKGTFTRKIVTRKRSLIT